MHTKTEITGIVLDTMPVCVLNNIDMTTKPLDDPKLAFLREQRTFHRHPENVVDEVFRSNDFFDPRDLVQVRYEMLRRHRIDGKAVSDVAHSFGVSRQAFYVTDASFRNRGLPGLLPRRRGPRRAHKCTDEILDFVEQWRETDGKDSVVEAVRRRFGVTLNPRSIERALKRRKKNRRRNWRHKADAFSIESGLYGGSVRSAPQTGAGDQLGFTPGAWVGTFSGPWNAGLARCACCIGAISGKAVPSERERIVAW
jgi:transposase